MSTENNGYIWNPVSQAWELPGATPPPPPPPPARTPPPPPNAAAIGAQAGHAPQGQMPPAPPAQAASNGYVDLTVKLKTGEVRFNYFYVLARDKEGKQRSVIFWPKTDTATTAAMEQASLEAVAKKFPAGAPPYYRKAIKDGDTYASPQTGKPADDCYKGCYFISAFATDKQPVGVVDQYGNVIMDPRVMSSGDYGRASLSFFYLDRPDNKGVSVMLNSVMMTRKGVSLMPEGGGAQNFNAENEFRNDFIAPPPGYVAPVPGVAAQAGHTPPPPPPPAAQTPPPPPPPVKQPIMQNGYMLDETTNTWVLP